ncbi:hypothetical protein BY458DRAFT_523041 [Sporodiniella umbellata]|nr:hypothetical protein BY458DRAFT_523041 [Sporodiniella umbellata]
MSSHRPSSSNNSVHSLSNRSPTSSIQQETLAKVYFEELDRYLVFILSQEAREGVPVARVTARQKLSRLNNLQFHELATDVYDELLRRTNDRHGSFLPNREDFHPRRNQARQKLASLPGDRFRDLSSDIHYEIKRRYPFVEKTKANGKPSQSTHIVPVKGMMSVESIDYLDEDLGVMKASRTENLDSLMSDLGNMVKPSPGEPKTTEEDIRRAYESKVISMAQQIKSLQLSLEKTGGSCGNKNEGGDELKEKYNRLLNDHREQQAAAQGVKNESRQLIEELKQLSEKNENLRMEKERAENEIERLCEESKAWRTRYESLQSEMRTYKVRSVQYDPGDALSRVLKPTSKGAIEHPLILEYQKAIDALMQTSRSAEPTDVLNSMRTIVFSCKSITAQVEAYEIQRGLSETDQTRLYELKKRFSTGLSGLLSATTGFAYGMGLSPVSLVDAAAVTLTTTMVDLVKLLGIRSVTATGQGVHRNSHLLGPRQLSPFLKREAEQMMNSVQSLLAAMRSGENDVFQLMTFIVQMVSNILSVSRRSLSAPEGARYQPEGLLILFELEKCHHHILNLRDTRFSSQEPIHPMTQQSLAQVSCDLEKYIQKLIDILEM